jgi:hypothetical protein
LLAFVQASTLGGLCGHFCLSVVQNELCVPGNLNESFQVCSMNVLFFFAVLLHFQGDCVLAYDAL